MAKSVRTVRPNAGRLIEGLRDTGYTFNTALADIVDNSVDAGADSIDLLLKMDEDGDILVSVADNGCGMDEEALVRGMTYGADDQANNERLGKFGLGMKTASTSFCRLLSVISRPSAKGAIMKATWDLDHVVETDDWDLIIDDAPKKAEIDLLEKTASGSSGTLVIWDRVDRMLKDYKDPGGNAAQRSFKKIVAGFKFHTAKVYQRFLDPKDKRAKTITNSVNGESISSWDPFCTNEDQTEIVASESLQVIKPDGKEGICHLKAYVLPRREQFSTDEAAQVADITNDNQGIYTYRENRLINQSWCGMFSNEPHISLLRV